MQQLKKKKFRNKQDNRGRNQYKVTIIKDTTLASLSV